jgi:hypothetical protein
VHATCDSLDAVRGAGLVDVRGKAVCMVARALSKSKLNPGRNGSLRAAWRAASCNVLPSAVGEEAAGLRLRSAMSPRWQVCCLSLS